MHHYTLDTYPRRFSLLPPLLAAGFLPQKQHRIVTTFNECNFSLILEGSGEYILRGRVYPVQAPCILLQWPGEPMDYGPESSWTELYLIYPGTMLEQWQKSGLFSIENPVRKLENAGIVLPLVHQFLDLLKHPDFFIDEIDLLAGEILIKSGVPHAPVPKENPQINMILEQLESSIGKDIDCRRLAQKLNMSVASLRRCWKKSFEEQTFSQYRNNLMLQKSCQLLVETELSIKEIAEKIGFADPFYFSRKFHGLMGMPPLEYRKKYVR